MVSLKSIKKNLLHFTERLHNGLNSAAVCAPVLRQLPPLQPAAFQMATGYSVSAGRASLRYPSTLAAAQTMGSSPSVPLQLLRAG